MRSFGCVTRSDEVASCVKKMHSVVLEIASSLVEFPFALSELVFFLLKL